MPAIDMLELRPANQSAAGSRPPRDTQIPLVCGARAESLDAKSGGSKSLDRRWVTRKFMQGEIKVACANGETRALKLFVDWQDDCINGEHLWVYAGSSSEVCFVGENECLKHGPRLCCSACKINAHTSCMGILIDKIKFICKHTFKDLTVTHPRHNKELQQHNVIYHHWVHKRAHCGKCKQCAKTFGNTKLPFSSKDIQAITCSWCKVSYHNKENCYTLTALTEPCNLGVHRESIIPPTWILKLPSSSEANDGAKDNANISQNNNDNSSSANFTNDNNNNNNNSNNNIDADINDPSRRGIHYQEETQDGEGKFPQQQITCMTIESPVIGVFANQICAGLADPEADKENSSRHHQAASISIRDTPIERQHHQQCNYGSRVTLTTITDSSGYISADRSNSQSQASQQNFLPTDESKMIVSYEKCKNQNSNLDLVSPKRDPGQSDPSEIVMDPSALQTRDLSKLNLVHSQSSVISAKTDRHPQDKLSNSHYQRHQLKQFYSQIDASHNAEPVKICELGQDARGSSESLSINLQQQQMPSSPAENCFKNFKIVPQPVQGVPNAGSKPVLVFVNPRSGGNQGAKMMQKFNWLLNPRQVFDLIQSGGPRAALELYKDVPNIRILTIGGDGTASWILSHLDEVGIPNRIPVAVLPLGTGNDLARALGWGGGYADEPIAKILTQVRDGEVVQLDRWNLTVERNYEVAPSSPNEFSSSSILGLDTSPPSVSSSPSYFGASIWQASANNTASTISIIDQTNCCDTNMIQASASNLAASASFNADEGGIDRLPMDVINNYFSFGVDAHIALEFHTAREAHPERFNSRLRNKMFYGQAGGKDLLKRKWKDLSNHVTLYCDGQDMTSRLKELKVHSVLFLNISSYGGGTRPWPTTSTSFVKPRTDDGLIEVIGLTTYQLPLLQAGGHGTCIAQCRSARIITSKTIPMQVDGEPCNLLPSIINISFKNRVCMLAKSKSSSKGSNMTATNVRKMN